MLDCMNSYIYKNSVTLFDFSVADFDMKVAFCLS